MKSNNDSEMKKNISIYDIMDSILVQGSELSLRKTHNHLQVFPCAARESRI